MHRAFIPKENPQVPDAFGVTMEHIDGKVESYDITSQWLEYEGTLLVVVTAKDEWVWTPMSNIRRLIFDKRFSQLKAIQETELKKKETKNGQS